MCPFNGFILIGRIGSGGSDDVPKSRKKFLDFRITVQFPPLIQIDVFIGTCRSVLFQEVPKPVDGTGFGNASFTVKATSKVIGDDNGACFAIIAFKVLAAVFVFRSGTREPKVDRESLIGNSGCAGSIGASRFFVLFGADTSGTDIKDLTSVVGLRSEVGDTFYPFVGIVKVVVGDVAEALVPEKTGSFSRDRRYRSVTLDILVKGKGMEFRREMR